MLGVQFKFGGNIYPKVHTLGDFSKRFVRIAPSPSIQSFELGWQLFRPPHQPLQFVREGRKHCVNTYLSVHLCLVTIVAKVVVHVLFGILCDRSLHDLQGTLEFGAATKKTILMQ